MKLRSLPSSKLWSNRQQTILFMKKHFAIQVSGRVQGVFFRHSTQKKASQLNISGCVQNNSDGSVQIAAEGEEDPLKEFIDWCYHGPIMAKVEKVFVIEGKVQNLSRFEVKY